MSESNTRCNGCGKPLAEGDAVTRAAVGTIGKRASFKEKKEWGRFHQSCFNRSIDNPEATMNELKRQSRAAVAG